MTTDRVIDLTNLSDPIAGGVPATDRRLPGPGPVRLSVPGRVVALLPVVGLAAGSLWYPEQGDQTMFVIGARAMNEGAVYYRDLWDIKQPGMFWLYQVGERLSGLIGIPGLGTRLIEAALAVVAGVLALVVTSTWPLPRVVRLAVPGLVVGPYLAWSVMSGVGQVEGLMNVLLLGVLAAAWPRVPTRPRPAAAWALAGVLVGLVVLLKTIYAPLVAVPLLVALGLTWRLDRRSAGLRAAVAAAGAALPVGIAVAWLVHQGVLDVALRTTFELPAQIAANLSTPRPGSLAEVKRSAVYLFSLIGPLALVGLVGARRRRTLALDGALVAVTVLGLAMAVPQLWTPYRLLMFSAPVGLLAVRGLATCVDWSRTQWAAGRRPLAGVAALLVALFVLGGTAMTLRHTVAWAKVAVDRPLGLDTRSRVQRGYEPVPTTPERIAAVVRSRVAPRDQIYVFGDPLVLELLDARPGAEVTGWAIDMLPPSMARELARELERSRPRFVFVDPFYDPSIEPDTEADADAAADSALRDVISRHYRLIWSGEDGSWFETDDPGQPLPAPDGGVRVG